MKTHKSYLKLEVSHKPNIFFGTYEQRLIDWKNIRSIINEEQNPLEILSKIYFYCPRTKTKTDEFKTETWLEPWQGSDPEACGAPVWPHDGSKSGNVGI